MLLLGSAHLREHKSGTWRCRTGSGALLCAALLCAALPRWSHAERSLCRDGFGEFSSQFPTGVTVSVGASREGEFATHACSATLRWGNQALPVAQGAWGIDIDVMGADLGLGTPVVAFRVKQSEIDPLATYEVYSLAEPPRLLRTITGGDEYDAKDMNLRGHNEIWIDDVRAINGFENLPLSSWDFLPVAVHRFQDHVLIDVGSEFQPYFDHQISQVKSQLDATALDAFRKTDGRPSSSSPLLAGDLHMLIRTKIQVLEIVWSYLSSGRDEQAWSELAAMWPPSDLDRIRRAIQDARARGVLRQVDGTSARNSRIPWKHRATIFDCIKTDIYQTDPNAMAAAGHGQMVPAIAEQPPTVVDSRPQPIYLGMTYSRSHDEWLPVSSSKLYLNLLIDAAGKVRSSELENKKDKGPIADKVLDSAADWNFIPAFVGRHAVACRLRYGVWPKQ